MGLGQQAWINMYPCTVTPCCTLCVYVACVCVDTSVCVHVCVCVSGCVGQWGVVSVQYGSMWTGHWKECAGQREDGLGSNGGEAQQACWPCEAS